MVVLLTVTPALVFRKAKTRTYPVALRVTVLLFEEKALLLDLNRDDGSVGSDFKWFSYLLEGPKLRVQVS